MARFAAVRGPVVGNIRLEHALPAMALRHQERLPQMRPVVVKQ